MTDEVRVVARQVIIIIVLVWGSGGVGSLVSRRLGFNDRSAWIWLIGVVTGGVLMYLVKGWGLL